jgi:hypothetical protein
VFSSAEEVAERKSHFALEKDDLIYLAPVELKYGAKKDDQTLG